MGSYRNVVEALSLAAGSPVMVHVSTDVMHI